MLILLIYLYFITAMPVSKIWWFTRLSQPLWKTLTYIIHSGFISGYQNRYGDNLKPPTNVYHRMTA